MEGGRAMLGGHTTVAGSADQAALVLVSCWCLTSTLQHQAARGYQALYLTVLPLSCGYA